MGSVDKEVWLVTGAISGLGLATTMSAVHAGHGVIAPARDIDRVAKDNPDIEKMGGSWVKFDVREERTQDKIAKAIKEAGGKLDVVLNNAGQMLCSALEDASYAKLILLLVSTSTLSLLTS